MHHGQIALSLADRGNDGIAGDPVERVVELRDPGQRAFTAVLGCSRVEVLDDGIDLRQAQGGAVDDFQKEALPGVCGKVSVEVFDDSVVQIDQSAVGQFHARFAPGHLGNEVDSDIEADDGLEKGFEFFFIGPGGEAEEKIDGQMKGDLAVSGEVFFRLAVLDEEIGAGDNISKKFNKFGI